MGSLYQVTCAGWKNNPAAAMGGQASCNLIISHVFQLFFKPIGQPAPLAHMLAGFVLGPSGLSRTPLVKDNLSLENARAYFNSMTLICRTTFLFLIGLEMDIPYLLRDLRVACTVALGGVVMCSIIAAAISPVINQITQSNPTTNFSFTMFFMMAVANSATPLIIRFVTDLNIATSDVGRLATYSALINDMFCLLVLDATSVFSKGADEPQKSGTPTSIRKGFVCMIVVGGVIVLNKYVAAWLNKRNRNQKYLKNAQLLCILSFVVATAMFVETWSFNAIISSFLLGVMFPRGGRTTRTLLHKLNYSMRIFILPVYFGFVGFQADVTELKDFKSFAILLLIIVSGIGGKILGTLAACHYLEIPLSEYAVLPFLLSLKGHVDLQIITFGYNEKKFSNQLNYIMIMAIVVNAAILGPVITFILRRESKTLTYRHVALELQNPESTELRVLACVHGPRHVATMLWLIMTSNGSQNIPTVPYLMHLIELPEITKPSIMYHQVDLDELSDDEDYGRNEVAEVNDAVDTFVSETGVLIRQVKAVSRFATMYEDVCNGAEDMRASIVFIPFHKHQRIDGKMESGKEGIRTTNQKVLRHAPCSVAILVDRGLAGAPQILSGSETLQHVANLFFGGPDDREALAHSIRMCMHPQVNLTVIRFLPVSSKKYDAGIDVALQRNEEVLMEISSHETKNQEDTAFVADFYNRYVTTGRVGYVERYVDNGRQTAEALRDMGDMYSLFVVGRGGRGHLPMTTEMSDWEECPELGAVGDLLASSEFEISGSVLVIQQHRPSEKGPDDDQS